MIKEDVDAEEIADVVSKWTGIPVSKMLEGEKTKLLRLEEELGKRVIEERYVSGFGMHMPFNDARRLRKSDSAYSVPFVLVGGPNPPYPERMPYAATELNSNSNAPADDPGIFTKTEVNQ